MDNIYSAAHLIILRFCSAKIEQICRLIYNLGNFYYIGTVGQAWPKIKAIVLNIFSVRSVRARSLLSQPLLHTVPGTPSDLNTGNSTEGATGCPSWCRPLRPRFHFLCSNLKANPVCFRGHPYMTSAKFSGFWTPSPPCPHLGLIYSTKFTQPPLLHLLLG